MGAGVTGTRRLIASLAASAAALTALIALKLVLVGPTTAAAALGSTAQVAPGSSPVTETDGSRSATGQAVATPFGAVQVKVTMSGTQIVAVTALALPDRDRHSQRLASYAEPILRQQALAAQSAAINGVSGATYTSWAYAQSLRSALDALG